MDDFGYGIMNPVFRFFSNLRIPHIPSENTCICNVGVKKGADGQEVGIVDGSNDAGHGPHIEVGKLAGG